MAGTAPVFIQYNRKTQQYSTVCNDSMSLIAYLIIAKLPFQTFTNQIMTVRDEAGVKSP